MEPQNRFGIVGVDYFQGEVALEALGFEQLERAPIVHVVAFVVGAKMEMLYVSLDKGPGLVHGLAPLQMMAYVPQHAQVRGVGLFQNLGTVLAQHIGVGFDQYKNAVLGGEGVLVVASLPGLVDARGQLCMSVWFWT